MRRGNKRHPELADEEKHRNKLISRVRARMEKRIDKIGKWRRLDTFFTRS